MRESYIVKICVVGGRAKAKSFDSEKECVEWINLKMNEINNVHHIEITKMVHRIISDFDNYDEQIQEVNTKFYYEW